MVAWVLPGVLPGVAWVLPGVLIGVTWRYPESYLVLPGRYLGCYFGMFCFLWSQNTRVPQTQTFEKMIFHLEMLPGLAPVLVTWLPDRLAHPQRLQTSS